MRQASEGRARRSRTAATVATLACAIALLLIGIFAIACGGTAATSTTAAGDTGTAQVVLKDFAFDPADVTVRAGESVTWTNQDSANHTVVADDGEFKSGGLANEDTFSITFAKAGTYPYHCGIHPTMKGTVTVQ